MRPRLNIQVNSDGTAEVELQMDRVKQKKTVAVTDLAAAFASPLEIKKKICAVVAGKTPWKVEIYDDAGVEALNRTTGETRYLSYSELMDFLEQLVGDLGQVSPNRVLAVITEDGRPTGLNLSLYSNGKAVARFRHPIASEKGHEEVKLSRLIQWLESLAPENAVRSIVGTVLPQGTVGYAKLSDGTEVVLLYREPGPADMWFFETMYPATPLPGLVFRFWLKNGDVLRTDVTAVKHSPFGLDESTPLYRYPFGNVYSDNRVCWGDNSLPRIDSSAALKGLVRLFLAAPDTGHLVGGGQNPRELYELLQGQEKFPEEMLAPLGITLGDWIKASR